MGKVETPFLKWPGGKRWLTAKLRGIIPKNYNRYIEPFLGSGSVFFALEPQNAILSDINSDLINLYVVMRDHPLELKEKMIDHNSAHSREYYYSVRSTEPSEQIDKAARFLYLNRTCYNGMYRVNRQGLFNVPVGSKGDCAYDVDLFLNYSTLLGNAQIIGSDFEPVIQVATDNDLIFADPPYVSNKDSNFIKYNDKLFSWEDQLRLLSCLCAARDRGTVVVHTNVYSEVVLNMYRSNGFFCQEVSRQSCIAGKAAGRRLVKELLITSFPTEA